MKALEVDDLGVDQDGEMNVLGGRHAYLAQLRPRRLEEGAPVCNGRSHRIKPKPQPVTAGLGPGQKAFSLERGHKTRDVALVNAEAPADLGDAEHRLRR